MSSEKEFSGRSWGVGVVRGVRAFDVDAQGRLKGVSYPSVWTPGENIATCGQKTVEDGWRFEYSMGEYLSSSVHAIYVGPDGSHTTNPPWKTPKPHELGDCSHGFYAYYDGSNDYKTDARISAVVEGYGETVIGTRGFRAEKARIVALCIPGEHGQSVSKRRFGWTKKVTKLALLWFFLAVVEAVLSLMLFVAGQSAQALVLLIAAFAFLGCGLLASRRPRLTPYPGKSDTDVPPGVVEKVRRNYPDVAFFTSFNSMVAAFPPDKGLEPSPETDPDFWTRS